jgi:hypothetical protein
MTNEEKQEWEEIHRTMSKYFNQEDVDLGLSLAVAVDYMAKKREGRGDDGEDD